MDHPWTIDADETDIVAIVAMHAGDVRQAPPARAPIGRHLAIGASLQARRVGDDAAGIISGEPRTRAKKNRTGMCDTARASQPDSKRHDKDEVPTHVLPARFFHPAQAKLGARLEACSRNEKPDHARRRGATFRIVAVWSRVFVENSATGRRCRGRISGGRCRTREAKFRSCSFARIDGVRLDGPTASPAADPWPVCHGAPTIDFGVAHRP